MSVGYSLPLRGRFSNEDSSSSSPPCNSSNKICQDSKWFKNPSPLIEEKLWVLISQRFSQMKAKISCKTMISNHCLGREISDLIVSG